MRVLLNIVVVVGLILLIIGFLFDIFMQAPDRALGYFDYYLPALMTIIFTIWAMMLLGLKKKYAKGFTLYKLILTGLLTYTIVWQLNYLKWTITKNFDSTIAFISNTFPMAIALLCCMGLVRLLIVSLASTGK